ncbi:hypothetical protein ACFY2W_14795 [Streptomyces sp. NPDC001262]|uniref:hypothetical protein n=1 Tax=Streptomyces TaxID=1883 RepID=UPI00369378F1
MNAGLPPWLHEGAKVFDPGVEREAIVQFIGEWQDPYTNRRFPNAVFLRPPSGGREWIANNPRVLRKADR